MEASYAALQTGIAGLQAENVQLVGEAEARQQHMEATYRDLQTGIYTLQVTSGIYDYLSTRHSTYSLNCAHVCAG